MQLYDSLQKQLSYWRHAVGGARVTSTCTNCQQNTGIWCSFTYRLHFRIMTGIFYRWDHSIFQYQTMCKSSIELVLFIKHSSPKWQEQTNTRAKLCCFPGKTNCIHCSCNTGFFGKLNKVIFPSQPKTHFFGDILLKQVLCSTVVDIDVSSSGRSAHTRNYSYIWSI